MIGLGLLVCVAAKAGALQHSQDKHFCESCGEQASITNIVNPFSLVDVKIAENTNEWKAQQLNLKYLLMLNVSSLSYNFKNTSGLPLDDAVPFGGWETPHGPVGDDRGHFTGHWLSASALMIEATGDAQLTKNAKELVSVLGECQKANAKKFPKFGPGYLSGFPTLYFDCLENLWQKPCRYMQVPYYNVHKIMQGMLDQYLLLSNKQALEIVTLMADYFYKRITTLIQTNGTSVWERVLDTEAGGMNDVMYQLYRVSGNADHLTMAHLFDKQKWFGPILNKTDILGGNHANTHLALTVGGAQRFDTIGPAKADSYRTGVEFFVETLTSAHSYSTGGSNFREYWTQPHQFGQTIVDVKDAIAGHDTEESCTTYNLLKILRHAFRWTTDARYMDMYSYAMTNGVMGIQKQNTPGVMLYLLPLGVGVTKGNSTRSWGTPFNSFWCCYGTGIESFSKLADSIYFQGKGATESVNATSDANTTSDAVTSSVDDLWVARYVSSTLRFTVGSEGEGEARGDAPDVLVTQQSSMDVDGKSTITLSSPSSQQPKMTFALHLRVPSWAIASKAVVTVNGKPISGAIVAGKWLTISRDWMVAGVDDTVLIVFPTEVRLRQLDDNSTSHAYTGMN